MRALFAVLVSTTAFVLAGVVAQTARLFAGRVPPDVLAITIARDLRGLSPTYGALAGPSFALAMALALLLARGRGRARFAICGVFGAMAPILMLTGVEAAFGVQPFRGADGAAGAAIQATLGALSGLLCAWLVAPRER